MFGQSFRLLVTTAGASLWHPQELPIGISADHPDRAASLGHQLLQRPRDPVRVIADDAAQEILLETMPALRGQDRRLLIQKRLQRYTENSLFAFSDSWRQDRAQELLAVLRLPAETPTVHWLQWLAALPNPLQGVSASADLLARFVTAEAPHYALGRSQIFQARADGTRHIVLQDGKAIMTRWLPVLTDAPEQAAQQLQRYDAEASTYLARYGFRGEPTLRRLLFLPAGSTSQSCEQALQTLGWSDLKLIETELPDPLLRLPQRLFDSAPTYLPPAARNKLQHRRLALVGRVAAALVLTAALGLGVLAWVEWQYTHRILLAVKAEETALRTKIAGQLAKGDRDLRARMEIRQIEALQRNWVRQEPWPWLQEVGKNLPPEIRLGDLVWQAPTATSGQTLALGLRIELPATDKDRAQLTGITLYQQLSQKLRAALPQLKLKETQAPFALAPQESFSDRAMLDTQSPTQTLARLELSEP
jgi:hypothetical protein